MGASSNQLPDLSSSSIFESGHDFLNSKLKKPTGYLLLDCHVPHYYPNPKIVYHFKTAIKYFRPAQNENLYLRQGSFYA